MLLRCATGMMAGPAGLAAGMVFVAGMATGVALGAGLAGAAALGKRMYEERQGWKAGAGDTPAAPPPEAPIPG